MNVDVNLFYFNPNGYGSEFFVMAENKIHAYKYLIKYLKNRLKEEKFYIISYMEELEVWEKVDPLNPTTFPEEYTLDEFKLGEVIETEI